MFFFDTVNLIMAKTEILQFDFGNCQKKVKYILFLTKENKKNGFNLV